MEIFTSSPPPEDDAIPSPDWTRMVHPEDLPRVSALMRDHLAGKTEMFESVHRLKHCEGEWRWVVGRARARTDGQGGLRRLVGVELDITERRLYEEALFREKERAQITLQSIGDGVVTTHAHGRVEYLNPVAEELTGWRVVDSLGRSIDEIFKCFHEETCEPLENPMAVAVRRADRRESSIGARGAARRPARGGAADAAPMGAKRGRPLGRRPRRGRRPAGAGAWRRSRAVAA